MDQSLEYLRRSCGPTRVVGKGAEIGVMRKMEGGDEVHTQRKRREGENLCAAHI